MSTLREVGQRHPIPREGFVDPNTRANFSVAQHISAEMRPPPLTDISKPDLLRALYVGRLKEYNMAYTPMSVAAVAPNADVLFETYVVEKIRKHTAIGRNKMLVPEIGYPLAIWNKKKLKDNGVTLYEGNQGGTDEPLLERYVREGKKLPEDVGVVYMDIPSTFYNRLIPREQIVEFVNNNPDVLFVFDQANQGFSDDAEENRMQDLGNIASDLPNFALNSRVIVLNTTTKYYGQSGFSWCQATPTVAGSNREPEYIELESPSARLESLRALSIDAGVPDVGTAGISFPYDRTPGETFRGKIRAFRHQLGGLLTEKFGDNIFPFGVGKTSHVIVDIRGLGFATDDECVGYFKDQGIAIKSCKFYGDVTNTPNLRNFVYISIPVEDESFERLRTVLATMKKKK